MAAFFVHWFDDLYAVEYVDGVVDGLRTASLSIVLTGTASQVQTYRDNYACKPNPVGKYLQAKPM
jgi:hypothetical protein